MKVHKYKLDIGPNALMLSSWTVFLSVGEQDGEIKLWATDAEDGTTSLYNIGVYATGQEVGAVWRRFIGTVQKRSGTVWHVFLL